MGQGLPGEKEVMTGEMSDTINMRLLALEALLEIEREGKQSHWVIRDYLEKYQYLPRQDRAFFTRLCQGTLEYRIQLDYILDSFSKVPARKMKPVLREILRMAIYQMKYMDSVPDSAAVNEAVKLAQKKGFHQLKGFVNGVLRTAARRLQEVEYPSREADPVRYLAVTYSMPDWLILPWQKQFGFEATETICKAFLQPSPLTVRIRPAADQTTDPACHPGVRQTTDSAAYGTPLSSEENFEEVLDSLRSQGVTPKKAPYLDYAWELSGYDSLQELDAFGQGRIQAQDVSSMLAVEAAGIRPGDRVLDLCAAPGGKSLLSADKVGQAGQVEARDLTSYKVGLIEENIERCGLTNITARLADARKYDQSRRAWADVVLADLPCSGYGVIGRKPDIKYKASPDRQKALAQLQREILTNAVTYVKPGGTLLYSTCTLSQEENLDNVRWLLSRFPFRLDSLVPYLCPQLQGGTAPQGYLQLLPGLQACDGFFIARLVKKE